MPDDNENCVVRLCALDDVPSDAPLRICIAGQAAIAVVKVNGSIYAFADECTHGAGSLSDGFIDDDVIVCPVHAGEFHPNIFAALANGNVVFVLPKLFNFTIDSSGH